MPDATTDYDEALDSAVTAPAPAKYPDTPAGMLQEQYDELLSEASATRATAEQYLARASAAEARAGQVRAAIAALTSQENPA